MEIEITGGNVKINTKDVNNIQETAGIYPIHCNQIDDHMYDKADHTALEIRDAIKASMLPVLFLHTGLADVICLPSSTVSHSDDVEQYEFSGWASWYGKFCIAIDTEGNAFLPK